MLADTVEMTFYTTEMHADSYEVMNAFFILKVNWQEMHFDAGEMQQEGTLIYKLFVKTFGISKKFVKL